MNVKKNNRKKISKRYKYTVKELIKKCKKVKNLKRYGNTVKQKKKHNMYNERNLTSGKITNSTKKAHINF